MVDEENQSQSDEADIFKVLGAEDIPEEDKVALLTQMFELVQTRVFGKVYERLTEAQREEYLKVLEKEDPDAMEEYLGGHIPEYADLYEEEARILRQQLMLKFSSAS